ncbi:MAG: alpha/beta hydrolase [Chitinophagales bacterium]|nr:alpha/beta hydrolase [Chitinophagales bacterium]
MDAEKIKKVISEHEASGRYITINGIKTFMLDQGTGETVFCIHGVPTSSFLYRKVVKELKTSGLRAIALDLPGLGLSDRPEDFDYRFPVFASFCKDFLDNIRVQQFHLIVHDIGAPIGFALAAMVSDRVRSITILNSMLDLENFTKPLLMRPFEKPILGEAELMTLTHATWPLMMKYACVENLDAIPKEETAAYIDLLKREDNGKAFLKIMRQFEQTHEFTTTCYAAVQNPVYPVQLIWGKNDPFLPYDEFAVQFQKARPDVPTFPVEAKHLLQEEQFEFIAQKVKELVLQTSSFNHSKPGNNQKSL